MLIAGVDDAGRGAVIGPIVIAGVLLQNHQIPQLKEIGVKDSKALSPSRRGILNQEVKRLSSKWEVLELHPSKVDKVVFEGRKYRRLNWLEATAMAEIINKLHPEIAYVDASDIDENRFAQYIRKMIPSEIMVISEHRADVKYPIVSAASIVAKVHRDETIAFLRKKYGDFGSGYSSDPKTRRFLANWIQEKRCVPSIARKSWKTIQNLMEAK